MEQQPHPLKMLRRAMLAGVLILAVGCSQPVRNQGMTNQVPTDVRGPVSTGHLGSKELENTTDAMLESIVSRLDDLRRDEDGRTVIVMDRIENKSHLPTTDTEIFLAQLRRKLNQSGARYQIMFVENPRLAAGVRNRVLEDALKDDYDTPGLRPHYALTGKLYAIDEAGARYWEMFFELMDIDPASRYRNVIVWEDSRGYRFAR